MGQDLIDGVAVRVLREKDGQAQSALAKQVGISPQYMSDIEAGRRDAKPDVLKRIAVALNVPLSMIEKRRSA
jgi:transcriptional regulator with XRE-family HTH domain